MQRWGRSFSRISSSALTIWSVPAFPGWKPSGVRESGLFLGLLATRVLAFIVYQATPRDPLVLAGVVLAMSLLGLFATWIPAQRALSIDPVILLRAE